MALQVVLLGPPASGKGTQGRRLAEALSVDYLGTGALLRELLENGGAQADEIRPILARGGYLPDGLMCGIMAEWLAGHRRGWVLDGFPRSVDQAGFLDSWLGDRGEALDAAVLLDVPKPELVARIDQRVECPSCRWSGRADDRRDGARCPDCGGRAGRRADDRLENFLSRYGEYQRHTVPTIDVYSAAGVLLRCEASDRMDRVAERLEREVRNLTSHGQAT